MVKLDGQIHALDGRLNLSLSPLDWLRGPRLKFDLGNEHGLYALFLRDGAKLDGISHGERGLLYIGLAASRQGLKGRCHFNAQTRNHSPRKSLAVLLMDELTLEPFLIVKPRARNTWGLASASEQRLTEWMYEYLQLAVYPCRDPKPLEDELITRFAPPLNLVKCAQTTDHRRIWAARSKVLAKLEAVGSLAKAIKPTSERLEARPNVGRKKAAASDREITSLQTAEAIAAHFGLNPKSYRHRLRASISWYQKPQVWTFSPGGPEWEDMIAVAKRMAFGAIE